jgi:hypothetical protein
LAGVELDDLMGLVVRDVREVLCDVLAAVGPVRVRVRVVDLDQDPVHADLVPRGDATSVVDEAAPDVLAEQLRGTR